MNCCHNLRDSWKAKLTEFGHRIVVWNMEKTLVVDNAAMGRELAGGLLEERPDWTVPYAQDGKEALAQLERSTCPSQ
jgi:hypothetical protein